MRLTGLRPHLAEFLRQASSLYELYMYTFGTRAYAHKVAQIIDPNDRMFKGRILARDDGGWFLLLPLCCDTYPILDIDFKTLKKIFPVDDSMVVIVDDREDVWKKSRNLVRIEPCTFKTFLIRWLLGY